MSQKSATFDEVSHLPAGYAYLREQAIRYNPQHPPLMKEISALPLLFLDLHYPDNPPDNEWIFGREFLFSQDARQILFLGRIPAVFLSTVMALLVMLWATKLWGKAGGLLALCLYAFDPTIAAHSQLVTTDVGVACFSVLYLWCLRAYLQNPSWKRVLYSGLSLGLALGTKFSAVILIPVTLLLFAISAFKNAATEGAVAEGVSSRSNLIKSRQQWNSVGSYLAAFGFMMGLAVIFVWAIYFFPKDPLFYWKGIQAVNR
ncbi:MAG: glycosyltransferase family 39 protein, partial [Terriglobia bacterium]